MMNKEGAAKMQVMYLVRLTFLFCLSVAAAKYDESNVKKNRMQTYIVFVEKPVSQKFHVQSSEELENWYQSFLPETSDNSNQLFSPRLVHAYRNVATGFAARLTPEEIKAMKKKKGFISAHLERIRPLLTTHSPAFLGLNQGSGFWEQANYGEGVIIGMLDTGITPDHPSFNEDGMPPPPAKWKGKCEYNVTLCNNKLIGAKNFIGAGKGNVTKRFPFDIDGHGTHTSGTAAGRFVKGASLYGQANGTAVGIAPNAHLAMYKVCAGFGCADGDILAALDAAVEDGVDC